MSNVQNNLHEFFTFDDQELSLTILPEPRLSILTGSASKNVQKFEKMI